jgi:hypothetical protein
MNFAAIAEVGKGRFSIVAMTDSSQIPSDAFGGR